MLQIEQVSFTYSGTEKPALCNFSLEVQRGELVAVIGESGCGKTTLLRLIAGLEIPQKGSIAISGKAIASAEKWVKPEKRRVGMVFQDYALFPHLTVSENIEFGIEGSASEKNKRSAEVLALVGLSGYEKRYPHQLSGGQQQRVAIARALAPQPELLLLDEPFSNLDELLKDQVRDELFDLLEQLQITTLFVTHDTRDTLATADRIAVLKNGFLQQYGKPEELYFQPANEYVAVFLGKANLLHVNEVGNTLQTPIGNFAKLTNKHKISKICIRPESILVQAASRNEGQNIGKVKKIRFFGSYWEYLIVGQGWQLTARTGFVPDISVDSSVLVNILQYACLP
ncbi:MAG: ABC transporter ATP-binding protein [Cytophagales bacterium]|nr:ABC transporter ATP-binding protein [Bernardetiaceae bacterium]MDW8211235.1 ABC transporter ATP-binding protein [Cytophagales bacterium]